MGGKLIRVMMSGQESVRQALQAKKKEIGNPSPSVVVGYGTHYAIYQHENLAYKHAPGKTARFLVAPARRLTRRYGKVLRKVMNAGGSFTDGLEGCGHLISAVSRQLVPEDTGLLLSTLTVRRETP